MTEYDLLKAIGDIDVKYINQAAEDTPIDIRSLREYDGDFEMPLENTVDLHNGGRSVRKQSVGFALRAAAAAAVVAAVVLCGVICRRELHKPSSVPEAAEELVLTMPQGTTRVVITDKDSGQFVTAESVESVGETVKKLWFPGESVAEGGTPVRREYVFTCYSGEELCAEITYATISGRELSVVGMIPAADSEKYPYGADEAFPEDIPGNYTVASLQNSDIEVKYGNYISADSTGASAVTRTTDRNARASCEAVFYWYDTETDRFGACEKSFGNSGSASVYADSLEGTGRRYYMVVSSHEVSGDRQECFCTGFETTVP